MAHHKPAHYRPDIDGLRAVAVLLVVAYHAFPKRVPGGFVGVDVFFVISGYLITGILLRDLAAGEFSLLSFYARRFRRIAPALVTMLLAVWLLGRYTLLADEFEGLGQHILAGATFTSNFLLWKQAGYFDTAAELKPLLHLWSLAIEEQFYLLWPMLLALWYRRRLNIAFLVGGLLALSLGANLWRTEFYLLPTRFWELLIGCGLAWWEQHSPQTAPRFANLKVVIAAAALLAVSFLYDRTQPYPGWRALVPTVAAFLFISAGPTAWINRRVLSNPLAVLIGLISYPLYLWHWPLLSIARLRADTTPSPAIRLAAVALSFVLAWLTWRFIERFAQTRLFQGAAPLRRARGYVTLALSLLAALGAVGWLTSRGALLTAAQKKMAVIAAYATYETEFSHYGHCFLQPDEGPERFDEDCYAASGGPTVLLWGDSFARHLYPGLREQLGPSVRIARLNASSCLPVLGFAPANRPHCAAANEFAIKQIEILKPQVVVLEGIWFYGYQSEGFFAQLDHTMERIKAAGVKRVVIAGELPMWEPTLPKVIQRSYLARGEAVPARTAVGVDRRFFDVDKAFAAHFAASDVRFVPMMDRLCDAGGCLALVGDDLSTDLIAFDAGHLTTAGSRYVARTLLAPALDGAFAPAR
ncbi:MAG TPA: acyltransferase family protein [Polyangia bacterium]|nr:acyltransferase family protein [Polyangia bacterium]